MKHTPGPWEVKNFISAGLEIYAPVNLGPDANESLLQPIYRVDVKPSLVVGDDGKAYVMISYEDYRQFPSMEFKGMQQANARLIAAAPELLEALQQLLISPHFATAFVTSAQLNAQKIIDKALGQSGADAPEKTS